MKQTCILVLGMHRSGTSALTGTLGLLDIYLGSELMEKNSSNEKGYFENNILYKINENLLSQINSSWDDMFFDEFKLENISELNELKEAIKKEFEYSDTFAIKDPRLAFLFPVYKKVLDELNIDIKIILPYRNPVEVATSLNTRDNMSMEKAMLLWAYHFLLAEKFSRGYKRVFIGFDELMTNTSDAITKISSKLSLKLDDIYMQNKQQIDDFLEPSLKHNNISIDNLPINTPKIVKDVLSLKERFNDIDSTKEFDTLRDELFSYQKLFYNDSVINSLDEIEKIQQSLQLKDDELEKIQQSLQLKDNELEKIQQSLQLKDNELEKIKQSLQLKDNELNKTKLELAKVYISKSWKITKPLRFVAEKIKRTVNIFKILLKLVGRVVKDPHLIKKAFYALSTNGLDATIEKIKLTVPNYSSVHKENNSSTYQQNNTLPTYFKTLKDKTYTPKVSVIVPNYNHAKYLKKRIDSILNQTYQNFELLLLDDCSKDDSRIILENYANKYPDKVKLLFNEKNAGNVFKQWRKGVENSCGELIWICESDDYCENDFLEQLVKQFKSPGVNIAFGKIQLCDVDGKFIDGLDSYREGAESNIWNKTLVSPANKWFSNAFGVNNVIANVGGCIFKKQNIASKVWEESETYKILGDWFLYAHIANGGLIAYEPSAVAYFRQHGLNTSVSSFTTVKYYTEHFSLMKTLKTMWDIPSDTIDKFYSKIEFQYNHFKCEKTLGKLEEHVNINELKSIQKNKQHILIGILAFHSGGGELFPINLANALQKEGNIVSLFVLNMNDINQDMYNLVDKRIAIYDSKFVEAYGVGNFLKDSSISLINTHMVSLDMFFLVKHKVNIPYYPTLHGSYEACKVPKDIIKTISNGVTQWIYTANRNLEVLDFLDIPENKFTKLPNAMPIENDLFPKSREELGIKEDTIVFTLVARGIKRKGWRAVINAFLKVEKKYSNIHLLLCGDGEETQKYKKIHKDNPKITFLGYQSAIHGLYRISDCAIVPTRFEGESYPLCIIQALQVGLPVIGTDVGEIKSMITTDKDNVAGIILPNERNTEKFTDYLTEAMAQMLIDEDRESSSTVSKELAKKYSMSNLAKMYKEVFINKTLYIHIGWPKTGTSAIQQFLVNNCKVLQNKYDLFYPDFGRWGDGSHHNIAFSLRKNPYCEVKSQEEQYKYLKALKRIIKSSNSKNILLSSECFNLYDNNVFKELFSNDNELKIKIICYLRDQDQYIESIYGQNVRDPFFKEQHIFKEYLDVFKDKLFYSRILKEWEKITDKNNFIIRHYNPNKFVNNNIIDDFLTIMDIKCNKKDFNYPVLSVNESYTKNALEYKRLLNIIMPKQEGKLVELLQRYSKQYPESKTSFLSNEEKNKFNLTFDKDNKSIQNEYKNCNFSSIKPYDTFENKDLYKGISKVTIEKITYFIFKNDKGTFKMIKDYCLIYQDKIEDNLQDLIDSFRKDMK